MDNSISSLLEGTLTKETNSKKSRIVRILENSSFILEKTLLTLSHNDLIKVINELSKIATSSSPMELTKPDYTSMPDSLLLNIVFSFFNNSRRKNKRDLTCILTLSSFKIQNFITILLEWNNKIKSTNKIDRDMIFKTHEELTNYLVCIVNLKNNFSQTSLNNFLQYESKCYTKYADICGISNISKFISRRDNLKYCITQFCQERLSEDDLRKELNYQYLYILEYIDELGKFTDEYFLLGILTLDICPQNDRYLNYLHNN